MITILIATRATTLKTVIKINDNYLAVSLSKVCLPNWNYYTLTFFNIAEFFITAECLRYKN